MPSPKKLTPVLAVIGLIVVASAAWWFQRGPGAGEGNSTAPAAGGPAAGGGGAGPASGGPGGPGAAAGGARPGAGGPGGPGGPVAVEVATARRLTITDDAQAVGTLRSRQGVMVRPEVAGRIVAMNFTDGQPVRRGQVLVQLDDTLQRAQLQQAEAQAAIARTNLQRSRELLAQQFISQSAVDQNAAALQVAEAQVALAQAQVARLKVLAPFDGRAGIRAVNVGDYVKDGADIVNLEDTRSMLVDLRLPERFAARLRGGQPVQLEVDAIAGRRFDGRVDAIDSQIDANGRSLLVRARVDNPAEVLKAGMFARARVVFDVRADAIVVPEEALVPIGGKQWLVRVVDGADGKPAARRLEARIGLRLPGQVEVLSGVAEGDRIVTAGHGRLMRDQPVPVRIVDLDKAGRGGPPGGGGPGGPGGPAGPGAAAAGGGSPAGAGAGAAVAAPVPGAVPSTTTGPAARPAAGTGG